MADFIVAGVLLAAAIRLSGACMPTLLREAVISLVVRDFNAVVDVLNAIATAQELLGELLLVVARHAARKHDAPFSA